MDPRVPERRVGASLLHLQKLDVVLQVHQRAGTELGVEQLAPRLLRRLSLPERPDLGDVDAVALVDDLIADRHDPPPQVAVSGDEAQPNERQALRAVRLAGGAEVVDEALDVHRQRPVLAVGAQAQIDLEDRLAPGVDRVGCAADQALEKLAVADRAAGAWGAGVAAGGLALVAVHHHQFDVGGVAQGAPAHFAQSENRVVRRKTGGAARLAVLRRERLPRQRKGMLNNHVGEAREAVAEKEEVRVPAQDMVRVDEVGLLILELVEDGHACLPVLGGVQTLAEAGGELVAGSAERRSAVVFAQKRQQVLVLEADEVFPQEVAGPQKARQFALCVGVRQQVSQLLPATAGLAVPERDAAHQFLEAGKRAAGVGGLVQGVGELLGHQDRKAKALGVVAGGERSAADLLDPELVADLVTLRGDLDGHDRHVLKCQGAGQ